MQTTLQFWKEKCKDEDGSQIPDRIEVQGKRAQNLLKDKATPNTRRKGKSFLKHSQIQGQQKIMSFLEPKLNSRTPSNFFPNSSVQTKNVTTAVGSCENLVGLKTTEARNSTGGQTEQLSGKKFNQ